MKRLTAWLVVSALLVSVIATAPAAEKTAPSKTPQSVFQVKVSNGNLSLEAKDAPRAKVSEEIGKQANITFDSNIGPEEKVTIRLDAVLGLSGLQKASRSSIPRIPRTKVVEYRGWLYWLKGEHSRRQLKSPLHRL
jgi:hypothetical protein